MVFSTPSLTPVKIQPILVLPTVRGPRLAGSGSKAFKNWIGTKLVMNGTWKQAGVYNLEELDPDPFMEALNEYGLPWVVVENPQMVD